MKHPDLDAVIEVPDSAVPIYRQSNWDVLTDQEVAELHKKRLQQSQAAESAMARAANPTPPPEANSEPEQPAPNKPSGSKSKENS